MCQSPYPLYTYHCTIYALQFNPLTSMHHASLVYKSTCVRTALCTSSLIFCCWIHVLSEMCLPIRECLFNWWYGHVPTQTAHDRQSAHIREITTRDRNGDGHL